MNPSDIMNAPELKTLDDLLPLAQDFVEHCARQKDAVPAALFLTGPQGAFLSPPGQFADLGEKLGYDQTARLMCVAHAASACVLILAVSGPKEDDSEPADPAPPAEDVMEHEEFVLLMGEDRSGSKQVYLPVIRSDNGRFFGFGESREGTILPGENHFGPLLAPLLPDELDCQRAQAILRANDAELVKLVTDKG
jgi:hypothetical protein